MCPAEDVITSVAPKDDIVTNQQVVLTLNPDDFVTQTVLGNNVARVAITTDSCDNPERRYVFASLPVYRLTMGPLCIFLLSPDSLSYIVYQQTTCNTS